MSKNDIFTFTAPNGVEVTGVVVQVIDYIITICICYAQNRLFTIRDDFGKLGDAIVIVDYCVIPELDAILEDYQHQLDMADDYADKTL